MSVWVSGQVDVWLKIFSFFIFKFFFHDHVFIEEISKEILSNGCTLRAGARFARLGRGLQEREQSCRDYSRRHFTIYTGLLRR